ncbi:MAG: hypothetical protein SGJ18_12150 [Pseudomonadota bacterium]|nr:hypothetical protein [Pseudomonadota bacterium]
MRAPLSLEIYLNKLDRALGPITISDKAEIITEIKNHVMEALARDPSQRVESILSSLGEPEAVANRYLLERGLKPPRLPRYPVIKWLTLGFLGTVGFICITTLLIVWKFSPVIDINDGQVKMFGGLIDMKGNIDWDMPDDFSIDAHIQGYDDDKDIFQNALAGTQDVVTKKITGVSLEYHNAAIRIETAEGSELEWKCITSNTRKKEVGEIENGIFKLDLGATDGGARCKLSIPKNIPITIRGHNGALSLMEPGFSVDAELHNAKVKIRPDDSLKYRFTLQAQNGKIDNFTSFDGPDALEIKISLHNGAINKE